MKFAGALETQPLVTDTTTFTSIAAMPRYAIIDSINEFVMIGNVVVSVTYSDINNAAVLIEIARKKGGYAPELSFGTHFFQDMVEAGIRYIPLYPDESGVEFNERFLNSSKNMLGNIVPEYAHLADVIRRVADQQHVTPGLPCGIHSGDNIAGDTCSLH